MSLRPLFFAVVLGLALPSSASAFCGFYVAGGDAKLFNDATQVVLLRHETTTVLSMQNSYQGPAENFAMVIPVPQVLQKENVRTLPKEIFDRVDQMSAPRLVEYWEQDPCAPHWDEEVMKSAVMESGAAPPTAGLGVKIEAQFEVGEYEVVVLSANDSTGLDTWLRGNNYKIPEGADPFFRPYIERGQFFFVARVNLDKVRYENGRAVLSPLRFQYTSDTFDLPIRLGMINSAGKQDLLMYILAPNQRYEVANYPNVTIPTNLEVRNDVRESFPQFYQALFDATVEKHPRAVVTEYSWNASNCDPCPGPTLNESDFLTLGADVTPGVSPWNWTLTRLHARYGISDIGEDLVFKKATGLVGGREFRQADGSLEQGASVQPNNDNAFQGRYIIRHEWTGKVTCDKPVFGNWGGPNNSDTPGTPLSAPSPNTAGKPPVAAQNVALANLLKQDLNELGVKAMQPANVPTTTPTATPTPSESPKQTPTGGCSSTEGGLALWGWAALLTLKRRTRAARRKKSDGQGDHVVS